MSYPSSDSEIYINKSVSWDIKRKSVWYYSSPTFELNNQECIITVHKSSNNLGFKNQYNINSVELKFTKSYSCSQFIVSLKFTKESPEYIFYVLPIGRNTSNFASRTQVLNESMLSCVDCRVFAKIFYQKLGFKISTFVDDMNYMLKSGIHSDFQIKACDTIFKVHKSMIATRSNVLKTMIQNNMLEKQTSELELHADPVVVQELLEYLYTNTCKLTADPIELFKLAHFLDLKELQIYCNNYLLNNIHLKNIISILDLTSYNDFNLKDLHHATIKFVNENEDFLATDLEFKQFLCNNIKLETITYILKLSYNHQLDNCLNKAMEFIRINYEKVLKDIEFQKCLESQPALNLKILQYCLDFFKANATTKNLIFTKECNCMK